MSRDNVYLLDILQAARVVWSTLQDDLPPLVRMLEKAVPPEED